ncbi:MAG: T9SS type A sorting domain-containing protein [Saprospiraceae bacterium]
MKKNRLTTFLYISLLFLTGTSTLLAQADEKLAEQDSLALVAFYWATDGPNWTSNQPGFGVDDLTSEWQERYKGQFNNWLDGPVKDWYGVTLEKRLVPNSTDSIYRVTQLSPVIGRRTDGQNQLKGYVPREIGLLTALERIRINGNDGFRDELMPDEIYHPSLQELDPEACWFDGDVSEALRNCTDMRKLNLRYNNFDYIPNFDFLNEAALRNQEGTQWLYNSRFSYALLERILDYYYTISPNTGEFLLEMRDMFDVGDEREIVAPLGSSVEMVCNDAGNQEDFITYQWTKNGISRFGKTKKTFAIANVKESDYADYSVKITNEYVKAYDTNGNYGEVFTKNIHLVPAPVPPVIKKAVATYNGQFVELYFSKPMSNAELAGYENITISADGATIAVVGAEVMGRIDKLVKLELASPLANGTTLSLSFENGDIVDQNGGLMEAITDLSVENRVRPTPQIATAATTLDGTGIVLNFDQYVNETSLAESTFLVEGNSAYEIASVTLMTGEVDAAISKNVLLTLTEGIVDTLEQITVAYDGGKIHGLYGGTLTKSDKIPVLNQVSVDKTDLLITFEDGTESLENIYLKGSWRAAVIPMYDDGTNGDAVANDHTWSYQLSLVEDAYSWDVLLRTEQEVIDTIRTEDPNTGVVTLTLVPSVVATDSLLSENILLNFSIAGRDLTGDTNYGIENLEVIFNVHTNGVSEAVYLMGIENDWADGTLMNTINTGELYSDTLYKQTAGNIIDYNYRVGTDWENLTPEPRQYIVKNGVNIINDFFGVFTDVDELEENPIKVYPNPSQTGFISIEGLEDFTNIAIFNVSGQLVQTITENIQNTLLLDLSTQARGIYLMKATSSSGQIYSSKIILQ